MHIYIFLCCVYLCMGMCVLMVTSLGTASGAVHLFIVLIQALSHWPEIHQVG